MSFDGNEVSAGRSGGGGGEGGGRGAEPIPEATIIQGAASMGPNISGVRVESVIGTGGQGTVYLGSQEYLNRRVAVKVLHKATNSKLADRFRREATILAGLHHPNIVACYSAGVSDTEECFMVMEYIDGPDLHDYVNDNGPLELGLALDLISDVAGALDHGLESSVIHRDIKPQNVLLHSGSTQTGRGLQAKLTDLGLARFTDDQGEGFELTEQGAVLGTPLTMAPEQSDDPDSVDHRTDIYGLGCVFYWALTGEKAFVAKTMAALYRVKTSGEGLKRIEADDRIPEPVKPLLTAMLAPEPGDRPQSYNELINALNDIRSGVAPDVPRRSRSKGQENGRGGWRMIAAGLGIAALAGIAWTLTGSNDEPDDGGGSSANGGGSSTNGGGSSAIGGGSSTNGGVDSGPGGTVTPVEENGGTSASVDPAPTVPDPIIDPVPAEEPTVIVLEAPLEDGEERPQFSGGWIFGGPPPGWARESGKPTAWLSMDGGGSEDRPNFPRALNSRGGECAATRAVPAGPWRLDGSMFVGPPGLGRPSVWTAAVDLMTADGRVLRIRLQYSASGFDDMALDGGAADDGNAADRASVLWMEAGDAGVEGFAPISFPAALVDESEREEVNQSALLRAGLSFSVIQKDGQVRVKVGESEVRDLTPESDFEGFSKIRIITMGGSAAWKDLVFKQP